MCRQLCCVIIWFDSLRDCYFCCVGKPHLFLLPQCHPHLPLHLTSYAVLLDCSAAFYLHLQLAFVKGEGHNVIIIFEPH
jgi:hypothetical protein